MARRQLGVLHTRQLRAAGWTPDRTRHEEDIGRWQRVAPSVIVMHNGPLTRAQSRWVGVLHAGDTAVLTQLTALETHGLSWTAEPIIHVLTPKGDLVEPLGGYRFHQSRRPYLHWSHAASEQPPRLDVEHAALLAAERDRYQRRAAGLLAATVQQGLTTADRLMLAAQQVRKLRHGKFFQLVLGDIAGGAQSFAEIDVGRLCARAHLRPPDRQSRRRDQTGRWRYLDLEWRLPNGRVIVLEVDGSFHMRTAHWWKDKKRERAVVVSGATVLRCASVELRLEPEGVIEDLVAIGVPRYDGFVCGQSA